MRQIIHKWKKRIIAFFSSLFSGPKICLVYILLGYFEGFVQWKISFAEFSQIFTKRITDAIFKIWFFPLLFTSDYEWMYDTYSPLVLFCSKHIWWRNEKHLNSQTNFFRRWQCSPCTWTTELPGTGFMWDKNCHELRPVLFIWVLQYLQSFINGIGWSPF